ncbi:MAG: lipid-A-disaccharide synthase N-terminal domain-containing protein [Planctomycetota bacterium]|jgi:lipid-A-disaccharide synthase-like uncharacterized protein
MRQLLCAAVLLLGLTALPITAAEPASQPIVQTLPAKAPSRMERVKKFLNPSQTCPHCKQEFAANRSLWMLLVGFIGQIFFTSRFLVQWIASERRKESYIPHVFWHLSIVGSIMLLAYAISIKAWPIILGQAFGVTVYGRNLALIARKKNREAAEAEAAATVKEETSER